jgi:hypothetical protein
LVVICFSGYKDKILTPNYKFLGFAKTLKQTKKLKDDKRISFIDFLYYLKDNKNNLDPHFKPQTSLFSHEKFEFLYLEKDNICDFFKKYNLKYEQVKGHKDTSTKNILKSQEMLYTKDYSFFKENIKNGLFYDYKYFLNDETKNIIYDIYKKDFEILGYDN